jgi:hypothetical protein
MAASVRPCSSAGAVSNVNIYQRKLIFEVACAVCSTSTTACTESDNHRLNHKQLHDKQLHDRLTAVHHRIV